MFRGPEVVVESEANVVVAEGEVGAPIEVAIVFRAVSFLFSFRVQWAVCCAPRVEFIAPGAEPVARKGALDELFDSFALLEPRFGGTDVLG